MADLQTMFNNGMGSYASMMLGQQQAQEQQVAQAKAAQEAEALKAKQLENQQTMAMNPLNQQFRQGQIDQQNAQTPGLAAQSATAQSQSRVQQGTEAAQIAVGLSKASVQIGEDGMSHMKQDAQKFVQAAALLEQVPVIQRPAALDKIIEKYGISKDSPFVKNFQGGDPNKLPDALRNMGNGMAMASEEYIQKKALAAQKAKDDMAQTKVHANATIEAARIGADSRIQIAAQASAARQAIAANKPKTIEAAITALSSIPESERTPDESRQLQQLSQQKIAQGSAGINPMAAQMLGQPNAMQTAQQQSPFMPQGQPQAQPQAVPQAVPAGFKQIGTSGGKPVYENAQGQRIIGK